MAILAALFAFGSRFAGKILTTALGWASTMLFGRVPAKRQYLLLGITFGSVIWIVSLIGVLLPDVGAFLLLFIPDQDIVPEPTIRMIMLIGALVAPAVIGGITLLLTDPAKRAPGDVLAAVVRGYPLTALLAVLLVFLAGLAVGRKSVSLARGWTDAHVPLVVLPGKYDEVAADLDAAVTAAGLDVEPRLAPAYLAMPARWLAAVAGTTAASLVPERMIRLQGRDLDILIYSMDLLVSGKPKAVSRARGDGQPPDHVSGASHRERRGPGHRGSPRRARRPRRCCFRRHLRLHALDRSTRRLPRRSKRSTRRSQESRSRTTNGRCFTASASRLSVTCAPALWPGRQWWGPRHRVRPGRAWPARSRNSGG